MNPSAAPGVAPASDAAKQGNLKVTAAVDLFWDVVAIALRILALMKAWQWCIVPVFGWPVIGYWGTAALVLLIMSLLGLNEGSISPLRMLAGERSILLSFSILLEAWIIGEMILLTR